MVWSGLVPAEAGAGVSFRAHGYKPNDIILSAVHKHHCRSSNVINSCISFSHLSGTKSQNSLEVSHTHTHREMQRPARLARRTDWRTKAHYYCFHNSLSWCFFFFVFRFFSWPEGELCFVLSSKLKTVTASQCYTFQLNAAFSGHV